MCFENHFGEMFVRGLLQLEPGAVIEFSNPGVKTILNVDGKLNWKTSSNRPLEDMNYWNSVASGFMLVLHKSGTIYIEGDLCVERCTRLWQKLSSARQKRFIMEGFLQKISLFVNALKFSG